MSLDFPSSPVIGQIYSDYVWDGEKWLVSHGDPDQGITDAPADTFIYGRKDAFWQRIPLPAQEPLTTDRQYFVRTDGNDANTGLGNAPSTAFKTLQKAWDTVAFLNIGPYGVSINVADGTYTQGVSCTNAPLGYTGGLRVAFIGNASNPSACLIQVNGGNCFQAGDSSGPMARIYMNGFKLQTTSSGHCMEVNNGSAIKFGAAMDFGQCAGIHIYCHTGGYVLFSPPGYTISGGASQHVLGDMNAVVVIHGATITFLNSPSFSAFVVARGGAFVLMDANVWVNKATVGGAKAAAETGAMIVSGQTSDITYFPGNGGVYEATGGHIDHGAPWTLYTPTVSGLVGTISGSATGRYKQDGKTVYLQVTMNITVVTGGVFPMVTFPNIFNPTAKFIGMAQKSDGTLWGAECLPETPFMILRDSHNGGVCAPGDSYSLSLIFETK